jgi:hypothetical protein
MFGHDNVSDDNKTILSTDLLEDLKEEVTSVWFGEKRTTLVTTEGDEVEMSVSVVTFEMTTHSV